MATMIGCTSSPPIAEFSAPPLRISPSGSTSQDFSNPAVRAALQALSKGNYAQANRDISLALSRDPRNASLHLLNAVTYHMRYRHGERDLFELAETGYRVALDLQGDMILAGKQLARLYFDNGDHVRAKRTATYVLTIEPDDIEAQTLLAAAAYQSADFQYALWALEKARKQAPEDTTLLRMAPLIYGAAGQIERAAMTLPQLPDKGEARRLSGRLEQWKRLYTQVQADEPPSPAAAPRADVSTTSTPSSAQADGAVPIDFSPPKPPPQMDPSTTDQGPRNFSWSDCQQQLTQQNSSSYSSSGSYSYGSAGNSGDETIALPALPSPCKGRPLPRMATVDAVMLRTDEMRGSSTGLNLLDGLSMFVSRNLSTTRSWGTNATSINKTVSGTIGIGANGTGGVLYSLNLFNATDSKAEVIARPSLLALDRQPAQFFSGSTVSIGLVGNLGGSTLADKPIGVSLSVTPTFIDDDTMLINVKAARSFFEEVAESSTFDQSLQTSRNMVVASVRMKFDETLILSGLNERETTKKNNRTPVLGDVPIVQNLFSHDAESDYTKSVLILLTPRRVANFDATVRAAEKLSPSVENEDPALIRDARQKALDELGGVLPNLPVAVRNMERNSIFKGVRTGDIRLEDWSEPSRIERLLSDALTYLYR